MQDFYGNLLKVFWREPPKSCRAPNTEELRCAEKEGLLEAFQIASTSKCSLNTALAQAGSCARCKFYQGEQRHLRCGFRSRIRVCSASSWALCQLLRSPPLPHLDMVENENGRNAIGILITKAGKPSGSGLEAPSLINLVVEVQESTNGARAGRTKAGKSHAEISRHVAPSKIRSYLLFLLPAHRLVSAGEAAPAASTTGLTLGSEMPLRGAALAPSEPFVWVRRHTI